MGEHFLRRTTLLAGAVLALSATSIGGTLADQPGSSRVDGDGAKYGKLDSRETSGFDAKLALARAYEQFAATRIWDPPDSASIDSQEPPPPPPPTVKTLDTRARSQNNDWYCGPAAGQVVINWSRGLFSNNLDGENASSNYKKQSDIADKMHTTNPEGTDGAGVKGGLNEFVLKPYPQWQYYYQEPADGSQFNAWIVADIAGSEMPLIPGVKPHKSGENVYHLPNWPNESTAKHWIVIRGYNGFWDGTDGPKVYYSDSTHGAGRYTTGALTMWKVTSFLWSGTVVW